MRKYDKYVARRTDLSNSRMQGVNNSNVSGASIDLTAINKIADVNSVTSLIKNNIKKK